ncbi:MAG: flavodoxin family protein [Desulfotomaculales bacterium]
MLLVVAVNGSPRRDGNTVKLLVCALEEAMKRGAETVLLHAVEGMAGVKPPYCLHCSSPCKGTCYEGTRLAEMFDILRQADGLLLGSPVYFGTVAGPLKAFWDKTRRLRKEKALLNVVGGGVVTGASRFGGQEATLRALHEMMLSQGMTIVGDGHLTDADAGHHGACAQEPVLNDRWGLDRARVLGRRVFEVARATAPLRAACTAAHTSP